MPSLEKIIVRNGNAAPTRWGRFVDAVRSITLGPYNSKDPVLARLFGGAPVAAGVQVNEQAAMSVAPFWAACTLIAGDCASLPLVLYKRLRDGGKERYPAHPLYSLLHDTPNDEMTSMTWRETWMLHALVTGNGYAEVERDGAGRPVALWPLMPSQVVPFRDGARLQYRVTSATREVIFDPRDILHLRGPSPDGVLGYDIVRQARQALGLAIASERFAATFFGNGTTFGGALSHPKSLGQKGADNLRASIDSLHQGADRAHKFLILEEGMQYTRFGVDPNHAQMLETRVHQVREIARFFKIPPSKLGDLADATFSNVEQETLSYYTSCLRPWLARIEQELQAKLVSPLERSQQQIEHVVEGLLRADVEKRGAFYAQMLSHGVMTPNEVRALENLSPIAGGDVAHKPMNTEALTEDV